LLFSKGDRKVAAEDLLAIVGHDGTGQEWIPRCQGAIRKIERELTVKLIGAGLGETFDAPESDANRCCACLRFLLRTSRTN
jgi:hypothetical protein